MEYGQICSNDEKDALEARNAVLQFDEIRRLAALGRPDPSSVKIDAAMVRHLHCFVAQDIYSFAGQFRDGPVGIDGTGHRPPPADEVLGHVEEMVKYVADHWCTPLDLDAQLAQPIAARSLHAAQFR